MQYVRRMQISKVNTQTEIVAFSSCCSGIVGLQSGHQRAHYFT